MFALTSAAWASDRAAAIRAFTNSWLGTPYLWGGTTRTGIDCSAFLREMYRELFAIELPRTTKQQIGLGMDLAMDPRNLSRGLEPGDLIFYIDRLGIPNHVVTYAGKDTIAHSVSGRGVVFDPISKIYGRRVVARRLLIPKSGGNRGFAAIPPAGPILPKEIPCPPEFKARPHELRLWSNKLITELKVFGDRELCEVRVLKEALRAKDAPIARQNADKLDFVEQYLENIDEAYQLFQR